MLQIFKDINQTSGKRIKFVRSEIISFSVIKFLYHLVVFKSAERVTVIF